MYEIQVNDMLVAYRSGLKGAKRAKCLNLALNTTIYDLNAFSREDGLDVI